MSFIVKFLFSVKIRLKGILGLKAVMVTILAICLTIAIVVFLFFGAPFVYSLVALLMLPIAIIFFSLRLVNHEPVKRLRVIRVIKHRR